MDGACFFFSCSAFDDDPPEQAAQDVRSGYDPLFFAPVEDQVLVYHVVFGVLGVDLELADDFFKPGLWGLYHYREVAVREGEEGAFLLNGVP